MDQDLEKSKPAPQEHENGHLEHSLRAAWNAPRAS
jgi:hypothetical protein